MRRRRRVFPVLPLAASPDLVFAWCWRTNEQGHLPHWPPPYVRSWLLPRVQQRSRGDASSSSDARSASLSARDAARAGGTGGPERRAAAASCPGQGRTAGVARRDCSSGVAAVLGRIHAQPPWRAPTCAAGPWLSAHRRTGTTAVLGRIHGLNMSKPKEA